MNSDVLLIKSDNNTTVANFALGEKFYDICISRLYYALFLKMKYIIQEHNPNFQVKNSLNSHDDTYRHFIFIINSYHYNYLGSLEIASLSDFHYLKRLRNRADYDNRIITEAEFNSDFYEKYEPFAHTINRIMEYIKENHHEE